jgi:hypothetical protein
MADDYLKGVNQQRQDEKMNKDRRTSRRGFLAGTGVIAAASLLFGGARPIRGEEESYPAGSH